MDQVKIGKFIALKRKEKNLTQSDLANMLYISDRAVSKWERGLNLPDASLMMELCKILGISVSELLTGEVVKKGEYMEKTERIIYDLKKANDEKNKQLLALEWVIGLTSSLAFLILIFIASYLEMADMVRYLLIALALLIFIPGMIGSLKIEQVAGYYECNKCHYRYIPSFSSVLWAIHYGRTRYLKCPKCNERSWNKKVLSKENHL